MKSNIEAADMELCCWSSKDCGNTTLVPVQVSADKEKIYSWYHHVVLWSHNATPWWQMNTRRFLMRILLAPDRRLKLDAVTDGQKEALMNDRAFDAQLFGSVCVQRDKSYWWYVLSFDFSVKNMHVRKKSPLRYLKQKGYIAQPEFPSLWPSVIIDCCCNRSMFSGLLLWIFRSARRRIDCLSSHGRMKARIIGKCF